MERKNYLGLGIMLAIFAALVSLMCIAFSYADVNDSDVSGTSESEVIKDVLNDSNGLTIKFDQQGISDAKFKQYVNVTEWQDPKDAISWDVNTKSLLFKESVVSFTVYTMSALPNQLNISAKDNLGQSLEASIQLTCEKSKVSFNEWGTLPEVPQTTSITIKPEFTDLDPTYDSAVISGKVQSESNDENLVGVPVYLASKKTGEIYVSTTTNSNGEYTLNNVKPEWINDADNNPSFIYSCSPGYELWYASFYPSDPRIEGNIAYFDENDIELGEAEVNVSGADHHQIFDIEMTLHRPDGDQKAIFHIPYFGLKNEDMNKGADLVVDENGLITGTATMETSNYIITIDLKCQANCDSGYKFDYLDLNGTRYNPGSTFTLDGVSEYTAVVNYQPVDQIAQTGDAIPFVALVGLGMVAVVAFVVARKQFN